MSGVDRLLWTRSSPLSCRFRPDPVGATAFRGEDGSVVPAGLPGCPPMNDVTRILSAIERGDPQASEQLLPLIYDELRTLAAQKLAKERHGQTLQATALVH